MNKLWVLSLLVFLTNCAKVVEGERFPAQDVPGSSKGDVIDPLNPGQLPKNWFTLDSSTNKVEGVSAELAYQRGLVKTGVTPIVVAVIDSGVDVSHPDLQGRLWTNPGEIPFNGLDDDQNGYVDDIYGWNFLGKIDATTLEVTRELVRYKNLKIARQAEGKDLTAEEQKYLNEVEKEVGVGKMEAQSRLDNAVRVKNQLETPYLVLVDKKALDVPFELLLRTQVEAIVSTDKEVLAAKEKLLELLTRFGLASTTRVISQIESSKERLDFYYNESFDPRKVAIGDNPDDFSDRSYGDNNVDFGDSSHGTHVAGIIAANRDNDFGIKGVAQDVRIMSIRAVPNGDEYDKDVANAVRYAVDNGARVINMSFGKSFSPHAAKVREAFSYAAEKNVLIVHAAGNDAQDNDQANNFPNRVIDREKQLEVPGWIEVAASTAKKSFGLPATFTNYGKVSVDLFAPGHQIVSTVPYGVKYDSFSGTSMASPAAAGVATLVLSQFPALTAVQLKALLMDSTVKYAGLDVFLPSAPEKRVLFDTLTVSGGMINAMTALGLGGSL